MRYNSDTLDINKRLAYVVVLVVVLFLFLPFVLFGENSAITIHDNLDQLIPYYKMFKDNTLFFKFDAPTKGFSEMSTLYYNFINFSLTPLLYHFFDDFVAYALNYCFYVIFGFFSMYFLLWKLIKIEKFLTILVSVAYAALPAVPTYYMAVNTLPFIIFMFIHFASYGTHKFSWKSILLFFYPVVSCLTTTGFFILGFWFLGIIVLGIKNRRLNISLFVGFLSLCIGYVLVDLRLFYVMFVLKTSLNRSILFIPGTPFFKSLVRYGLYGFYHAASLQRIIIVPLAFAVSLFCFRNVIRQTRIPDEAFLVKTKAVLNKIDSRIKLLLIFEVVILICYSIPALYDSGLLDNFITKYIHFLSGFNYGRVYVLNKVTWYLIFAICLQLILTVDAHNLIKKPKFFFQLPRIGVWVLVCLQIGYIVLKPELYNDQVQTWFNELTVKTGIAQKIMPDRNSNAFISYKEFFAEDLFSKIKEDISYSDERVVAFGYHPSVLMYNGFNCIDGYNNAYPLEYMQKFRRLIEPELKINQWAREYYDSWGGRMYLYSTELSFEPTKDKTVSSAKLNINIDVFKNDFSGKYILSRAEISNSSDLGIDLVKRYYDEESIYTIYLYKLA